MINDEIDEWLVSEDLIIVGSRPTVAQGLFIQIIIII